MFHCIYFGPKTTKKREINYCPTLLVFGTYITTVFAKRFFLLHPELIATFQIVISDFLL